MAPKCFHAWLTTLGCAPEKTDGVRDISSQVWTKTLLNYWMV